MTLHTCYKQVISYPVYIVFCNSDNSLFSNGPKKKNMVKYTTVRGTHMLPVVVLIVKFSVNPKQLMCDCVHTDGLFGFNISKGAAYIPNGCGEIRNLLIYTRLKCNP